MSNLPIVCLKKLEAINLKLCKAFYMQTSLKIHSFLCFHSDPNPFYMKVTRAELDNGGKAISDWFLIKWSKRLFVNSKPGVSTFKFERQRQKLKFFLVTMCHQIKFLLFSYFIILKMTEVRTKFHSALMRNERWKIWLKFHAELL